uniref:KIB1-4 beta-propeller domain-containing protein n=1 Tax=Arundo donax TaxID=35708 RepID=A0A0A8Z1U5_ARUDO
MLEQFEDVIYYRCDQHEGFYFLTSQERLMVFDSEFDGGGRVQGDLTFYELGGHRVASPPGAGQEVAGRYLVESEGRLLMVKRFISPGRGTVSFQILTLQWTSNKPYWQSSSTVLTGQLLFVGRGCSRAFHTGRSCPGFIYFLDDAEGFHEVPRSEKQYRCSDAGWCCYSTQYIEKRWPQGPRPDCPPWIWLFH